MFPSGASGQIINSQFEILKNKDETQCELDDVFFFNQPTSFFTLDSRIPDDIRKPLSEAEGCLHSNFLTGASGALRKSIFKLLKLNSIPEKNKKNEQYTYVERLNLLKDMFKDIDQDYVDTLKSIHGITSQELHENDWEDLSSSNLRLLIVVFKEILFEIYVLPDEKRKKKSTISKLELDAKNIKKDK